MHKSRKFKTKRQYLLLKKFPDCFKTPAVCLNFGFSVSYLVFGFYFYNLHILSSFSRFSGFLEYFISHFSIILRLFRLARLQRGAKAHSANTLDNASVRARRWQDFLPDFFPAPSSGLSKMCRPMVSSSAVSGVRGRFSRNTFNTLAPMAGSVNKHPPAGGNVLYPEFPGEFHCSSLRRPEMANSSSRFTNPPFGKRWGQ